MKRRGTRLHVCALSRTGTGGDDILTYSVVPVYSSAGLTPHWIESRGELESLLSSFDDASIERLDVWGHGRPGVLALGPSDRLTVCRESYQPLARVLARKLANGGELRLCGCAVGAYRLAGRCGPALILEMANVLGAVVKAMLDNVVACSFPASIDELDDHFRWAVAHPPANPLYSQEVKVELI